MTTLAVRNLTVSFNDTPACKDISLDIPDRELTVIVGRSGSGKSTLLRALNRLNEYLPNCHTTGRVELRTASETLNIYNTTTRLEEIRRRIGMVFQTPNVLPVSIARNVSMPLQLVRDISGNAARERVKIALESIGLWDEVKDRLNDPASQLSGGQQQRLCLARALALEPEVLLLDEPTSSVDHKSSEKLEELLVGLARKMPVVVVSHSLAQTRKLADTVFLMRDGQLVGHWDKSQHGSDNLEALLTEAF